MAPSLLPRAGTLAARAAGSVLAPVAHAAWEPYSRLVCAEDGAGWSVGEDMVELERVAQRLGARTAPRTWHRALRRQSIFYGDQHALLRPGWHHGENRVGVAWLHGRPGSDGAPEFDAIYDAVRLGHERLARVQVSHAEMEDVARSTGIDPAKVFRIPIGIGIDRFPLRDEAAREAARRSLAIPRDAFVVGSFQKDGVGWADGDEPKLVKGPDVLLAVIEELRPRVPGLHVLLSGPARGFVRRGLGRLGVPCTHVLAREQAKVAQLYTALDAYAVTSRQEGGPKAVLEAMATGVPLVSTRVGQAADLVRDGENGWLVDVEDAVAIADRLASLASSPSDLEAVMSAGRRTAEELSHERLLPRWRELLEGFVSLRA